ncbi:hypothetical protein EJ04DRAFT_542933 [Polyplosphaeria fusca]|uniref:Uncharacterized protein n=1 Tax=Polyplosphaeria fusca TaxID=682080 RepID=A0A9P4R2M4_9PLEO|nr:hypothetical protein EJ04DRAFT_542933 [Polyplosphaeria fusca]
MARPLPSSVDAVIIGNGPSALILSYILHGHVPYYVGGHQDTILDSKLSERPCLLDLTPDLHAHFLSSLRYSTQALPLNTLLDTLLRPNADTETNPQSCLEWRYEPEKAISHVAIGDAAEAGGQWAENPVSASADIGTLSYAEMLSLPGYSYSEHLAKNKREMQCDFVRPSRTQVADYLRAYPHAVGISDAVCTNLRADNVHRTVDGFMIGSLGIKCNSLVLASGIFTVNIPPTPTLAPVANLNTQCEPLLVVGSGFSAADVIISAPKSRKIVHMFQWAPETRPSPLRGCHHSAYPEYATVYRQMRLAAIGTRKSISANSPLLRRKSNPFFAQREWTTMYEGLPNAQVQSVHLDEAKTTASITIRLEDGTLINRTIGGLAYVVGRRGSLNYLSAELRKEVLGTDPGPVDFPSSTLISGRTLRSKAEISLEVAKDVFVIGSLAGDSLIRHAVGGCVFAAGRILAAIPSTFSRPSSSSSSLLVSTATSPCPTSASEEYASRENSSIPSTPMLLANGHSDLHLDRRKLAKAVDIANAESKNWVDMAVWGR